MSKLKDIARYIQIWKKGHGKTQATLRRENKAERDQPNGVCLQRLVDHFAKGKSTALNGDNQRKGGAILVSLVVMPGIGKLQKEHQLHTLWIWKKRERRGEGEDENVSFKCRD